MKKLTFYAIIITTIIFSSLSIFLTIKNHNANAEEIIQRIEKESLIAKDLDEKGLREFRVLPPESEEPKERPPVFREGRFHPPGEKDFASFLRLPKEEEEKVENFVRENDPIQYRDLQEMKSRDEFLYHRMMRDMHGHILFMERLRKEKPEIFKCMVEERRLESLCRELVKKIQREKDREKIQSIKDDLRKNLSKMFDLRQRAKDEKIKDLERELQSLKAKSEERKKNKDKIVEYRLQELLSKAEGMEW